MPEPRKPMVRAGVSRRKLEHAVARLAIARYPRRLAAIDAALQRMDAEERGERTGRAA